VPVALLCRDVAERLRAPVRTAWWSCCRSLQRRMHLNGIRLLLAELSQRSGELTGAAAAEISDLVQHLMRTRRTGGLLVGEEGRAFFVRACSRRPAARPHHGAALAG